MNKKTAKANAEDAARTAKKLLRKRRRVTEKIFTDAVRVLGLPDKKSPFEGPKSRLETPKKTKSPSAKKMFEDAKKTLEERDARPPREPAKDWDETRIEYVKRYKRERREALLLECVPERKCPVCGKLRLRSAQWVEIVRKHLDRFQDMPERLEILEKHLGRVICRSCVTAWNYERRLLKGLNMGRRKENSSDGRS